MFGQPITIRTPHQVQALVSSKETEWLSPRRLIQVQAMLLDNPLATIKNCHTLNPATLLPAEMGPLECDCIETIDTIQTNCRYLGSLKCGRGRVQGREEFNERRKKASEICSDLPDPSHRGTKPNPWDFCPKGRSDSPHLSLRAQDREDLKHLHRFPVCVCHPTGTGAIWKERGSLLLRIKTDLALSLETPIIRKSKEIQSGL